MEFDEVYPVVQLPRKPKRLWVRVLVIGFALFAAGIILLVTTGNSNIFPTAVLLGTFLVPVAYVVFFYEHRHSGAVRVQVAAMTFLAGGVLGTFAAALLEPVFIHNFDARSVAGIGLIEEAAKIVGVIIVGRTIRHDSELDGIVLGAAAGMGFASFESMGYAFSSFLSSGGSLSMTVWVILVRAVLSPVGHGTWTAILAAALFRESAAQRFVLNGKLLLVYLLVSLLHASWDGLPSLLSLLFQNGLEVFLGQAAIGAAGLLIVRRFYREGTRAVRLAV